MSKVFQKFLSLVMAITMVVGLLPMGAFAEGETVSSDSNVIDKISGLIPKNEPATQASTDNPTTVRVGENITLTGKSSKCGYSNWYSTSGWWYAGVDGNGATATVTGESEGTITVTHEYCTKNHANYYGRHDTKTETFTVTVTPKVEVRLESVAIDGVAEITAFNKAQLTAVLTPANGTYTAMSWESSNDEILTVDNSGNIYGVKPGAATVTLNVTRPDGTVATATHAVTVTKATTSTEQAMFYYLKTPTSNPASNDTGAWGRTLGNGTVNLTGATFTNNKNCFAPAGRVITWPDGSTGDTYTLPKDTSNGSHWRAIYDAFAKQQGITSYDDVLSITLTPYKISKNNSSNPDVHVDCTVTIVAKDRYTVRYFLWDAGESGYQYEDGTTLRNDGTALTTSYQDFNSIKNLPAKKTDRNGVIYTFDGWYTDENRTQKANFPYAVTGNVDFYAKYIAGYQVIYDLAGGNWNQALSYTKNVGETVNVIQTVPTRAGYTFAGWTTADVTIENGAFTMPEKNVTLTANWEKDDSQTKDIHYIVKHVVDGQERYSKTYDGTAWVNETNPTITVEEGSLKVVSYDGYKFERMDPETEEGDEVADGTAITLYYVKDDSQTQDTKYTVKYTIEGAEQSNDTVIVEGTAWVNDNPAKIAIAEGGIPAPADKYKGYKLDESNPEYPAAGELVNSGSVYTVNYVKDDSQTQDTKYMVKYTIEGAEQSNDTVTVEGTAWVNDNPAKIAIAEGGIPAPADKYTGYKLDPKNPEYPEAGELVDSGSVYTVNYVKDDSQTQSTKYTVIYTIEGVEQDRNEVTGTAWVNDNPVQIAIAEGGIPAPADKYKGYKLDESNPEYPAAGELVNSGSVYTVNYVKDDSQTQDTEYTVKYTIEGAEQSNDTVIVEGTAWVNDNPARIAIAEGGIPAPANKYTGYKLDESNPEYPEAGTMVNSGSVYTVNYVKDEDQTKEVSYTVKHVVGGVEQTADTKTYTANVWINEENPMIAIEEGSLAEKSYTGYRFDNISVDKDVKEVASGTVITLTYVKDESQTKEVSYTVKHVVGGVEQTADTKTYTAKVWINEENPTIAIAEGSLAEKNYTGYGFDHMDPKANEGDEVANGTVITLYYVKNSFKVIYKVDGEVVGEEENHDYNTNVTVRSDLTKDGYTFSGWTTEDVEVENGSFTMPGKDVTFVGTWTVRSDLGYTVHYYWNGTSTSVAEDKTVDGKTFDTTVTEAPIAVDGYTAVSNDSQSITISADASKNVIIFYYYRNVTLTANSSEVTYNGEEQSVSGFTGAPEDANFDNITVGAKGTNVSSYPANFEDGTVGTVDVTEKYIVAEAVNGKLTITTAEMTVSGTNYNGKYDDAEHGVAAEPSVTNGTKVEYSVDDGKTWSEDVPTIKNVGSVTVKVKATNPNYAEATCEYTLTVTPKELVVTTNGNTKIYDGQPLTAEGKVEGLVDGETVTFRVTGSQTNKGSSKNTYTLTWDGTAKQDNYTVTENIGTLTVDAKEIYVVTDGDTKVYDGQPLTAGGRVEGLVNGETATVTTTGSQTAVGSSSNTYGDIVWGETDSNNYVHNTDKDELGTLTVTPKSIDEIPNVEKQDVEVNTPEDHLYDGEIHQWVPTVSDQREIQRVLVQDRDYTVSYDTENFVDVKTVTVTIRGIGNYTGQVVRTYKITPRPVTVIAASNSWEYDGNDHTESGWSVAPSDAVSGLVKTDAIADVTVTGSQRIVGSSANVASDAVFAEGTLAGNYTVSYQDGTLEVTGRAVRYNLDVQPNGGNFLYDGTEHTVSGYTFQAEGATFASKLTTFFAVRSGAEGDSFTLGGNTYTLSGIAVAESRTNAGQTIVHVTGTPVVTDDQGNDVTDQFSVTLKTAELNVARRDVLLGSVSDAKRFDNTPLTNDGTYVGGENGFAPGEGATFNVTGSQTAVGFSTNWFTYTLNDNTLAENYDIRLAYGTLTVTEVRVYTLTVHYVDGSGAQLAPDYVGGFEAGAQYLVYSPAVEGYKPEFDFVRSAAEGMPEADVELTVVYTQDVQPAPGGEIVPTEDGGYDITPIIEDDVPLAGGGEHKDDIVHFLLMAAALVVQILFADKRKKTQKEIFELKQKLGDTSMDDDN